MKLPGGNPANLSGIGNDQPTRESAPRVNYLPIGGGNGAQRTGQLRLSADMPRMMTAYDFGGPQQLRREVRRVGDIAEEHVQRYQSLEAMQEISAFKDREREALVKMEGMKGQKGADAPSFMENFYKQEEENFRSKTRGAFQESIYLNMLSQRRQAGLSTATGYGQQQMQAWADSVTAGSLSDINIELQANPANANFHIKNGIALIETANPGLDNRAKINLFEETSVLTAVQAAVDQGDVATARSLLKEYGGRFGNKLRGVIVETERAVVVANLTQQGAAALRAGQGLEFTTQLTDMLINGEISPQAYEKATKNIEAVEAAESKQRKAKKTAAAEETNKNFLQLQTQGQLTPDMVLKDKTLSFAEQKAWMTALTSGKRSPAQQAQFIELDSGLRQAIEMGFIKNEAEFQQAVNGTGFSFVPEELNKLRSLIKTANEASVGGKINYYDEAMKVVKQKEVFTSMVEDKEDLKGKEKQAVALHNLDIQVRQTLKAKGIAMTDPEAGAALMEAAQATVTKNGGGWFGFDSEEPWWEMTDKMPELESLAGAGTPQQNEAQRAVSARMKILGAPANEFSVAWHSEAFIAGKSASEVIPSFAESFPGKGEVTIPMLGELGDYKDEIQLHSLNHGQDPDLVAAVIYTLKPEDSREVPDLAEKVAQTLMDAGSEKFSDKMQALGFTPEETSKVQDILEPKAAVPNKQTGARVSTEPFSAAMAHTLEFEGGYANNVHDSGGETFRGISRNNWPNWEGWAMIDQAKEEGNTSASSINSYFSGSESMAAAVNSFYRKNFWEPMSEVSDNPRVIEKLFDTAVNVGQSRAKKLAAKTLKNMGTENITDENVDEFLSSFSENQASFYRGIASRKPSQKRFLNGWLRRANWIPA